MKFGEELLCNWCNFKYWHCCQSFNWKSFCCGGLCYQKEKKRTVHSQRELLLGNHCYFLFSQHWQPVFSRYVFAWAAPWHWLKSAPFFSILCFLALLHRRWNSKIVLKIMLFLTNEGRRKLVTTVQDQCSILASRRALIMQKAKLETETHFTGYYLRFCEKMLIIGQLRKSGTFFGNSGHFIVLGEKKKRSVQPWVCGGYAEMPCLCQGERGRKRKDKQQKEK